MSERPPLEFLTRQGCSICDQARPLVARWAGRMGFRLVDRDVDADPELADRYGERIPVVRTGGGAVVVEGRFGTVELVLGLMRERGRGD